MAKKKKKPNKKPQGKKVPLVGGPYDGREITRKTDRPLVQFPITDLPGIPQMRAKYTFNGQKGYVFSGWLLGGSNREKELQYIPAYAPEASKLTRLLHSVWGVDDDKPPPLVIPIV